MNSVLQQFLVGKEENGIFKFCRKDSDNTKTLASCHRHGQHRTSTADHLRCQARLTQRVAADEIHQVRSVTRSLAWIARQTRPDLSYCISKIQSTFKNACVRDLRECNKIVEYTTSTSTRGIYFSSDFSWDDAIFVTINGASSCQEQEQIDGVTQNFK